jgi:aminomethyltransferase
LTIAPYFLQGPLAEDALAELLPDIREMRFLDVWAGSLLDMDCVLSRSGYTGEDGFEISIPADGAETLVRKLLHNPVVAMIGLGARDTLRLEAGLCLHGADVDATTTPVEADLQWSIQASRRHGGRRPGGFPGADIILKTGKWSDPQARGIAAAGTRPGTSWRALVC